MQKLKLELQLPQGNIHTLDNEYLKCSGCQGEYTRLLDSGLCPDCERIAQIQAREKGKQKLLIEACLGIKGVKEFTFENYKESKENHEAYIACKNFNPSAHNLYLYGGCGSGKTHLAGAAWRKRVEDGLSCEFIKHPELSRMFRKKEAEEENVLLKKFSDYDILVIDDIGVGRSTEFSSQILYEILDLRISNYKNGLILTSNFSLEELASKMMDDRLSSRIAGICQIIKVGGPDYRIK